ncbi:hypothetical protein C3L33_11895, partial [Rhododendron williamsianum]
MRPSDTDKPPYVARVEKIEADHRNNMKVHVRWYYRPEESIGGRRQFHGAKELFLSDHFDVQSAHTIEGKCIVHSFKNYTKLENVGAEDYFCRIGLTGNNVTLFGDLDLVPFEVTASVRCLITQMTSWCNVRGARTGGVLFRISESINTSKAQLGWCLSRDGAKKSLIWFHPSCMGMTIEEAKKLEQFMCSDCNSDDDAKRSLNSFPVSPPAEAKCREDPVLAGTRGFLIYWVEASLIYPVEPPHLSINVCYV